MGLFIILLGEVNGWSRVEVLYDWLSVKKMGQPTQIYQPDSFCHLPTHYTTLGNKIKGTGLNEPNCPEGRIYAQHVHPFTHFHKLHTLSPPHNETMRDDDRMTLTAVTVLLPLTKTNST